MSTALAPERRLGGRHRGTLLLLVALVAAVAVAALVAAGPSSVSPLDPDNPHADGAQALARVLAEQDVDVAVVRSADELEATEVDATTTVLVVRPELLGGTTVERLLEHAAPASRVVVAGAGPGAAAELGGPPPVQVPLGEPRSAGCDDPLVGDLEIQVDQAFEYDGPGCFRGDHGAVLADAGAGVVLLGADQALTNDQVLRADNAALALRLLGQEDRLVWYLPDPTDLTGSDGVGLATLLPRWLEPGLFLLALAVLAVLLWRGRRLGALASEPLPVVVRAVETTRSRGRLYRKAGDRSHAAAALRRAARSRVAERLRLPRDLDPADLVRAVADRTGRRADDVAALLDPYAPAPASNADLVALATALTALEEEVRRP